MSMHTVTITNAEDLEWTLDLCPGGDCTLWYPCKKCSDRDPTPEEQEAGEYNAHGEHHLNIDDEWMTETSSCALASTDSGAQGMCNIAAEAGVGTHQVQCGYWGDGHWDVDLIDPKRAEACICGTDLQPTCTDDHSMLRCPHCRTLDVYDPCPQQGFGCGSVPNIDCDCCTTEQRKNAESGTKS